MNESVRQYIRKHDITDININAYELHKKRKYTVLYIFMYLTA